MNPAELRLKAGDLVVHRYGDDPLPRVLEIVGICVASLPSYWVQGSVHPVVFESPTYRILSVTRPGVGLDFQEDGS